MRFDLVDLRLFVNIHEAGTITSGAEASHITLASASERLSAMEESLGAPLLSRGRKGITLTAAGRVLLPHARLMLQQAELMQGEMADFGAGIRGQVRMLCTTSGSNVYLPDILASFLVKHPLISIDLEERTSSAIVDALRNELCDVGLLSSAVDTSGLQLHSMRSDPLTLIVASTDVNFTSASAVFAEVLRHPFVGMPRGGALQEHIEQHARKLGRRVDYRICMASFEAVCKLVGQGVGVAIVPQTVATRYGDATGVRAVRLDESWASRELVVCVRDLDTLPLRSKLLVEHLLATAR